MDDMMYLTGTQMNFNQRSESVKENQSKVASTRPKSAYNVKGGVDMMRTTGRNEITFLKSSVQTQADYNPKFSLVHKKLDIGNAAMQKSISREKLPPGRPNDYSNLVELP